MTHVRIIVPLNRQRIVCPVLKTTVSLFSKAGLEYALKAFATDFIAPERARYALLLETFDKYLKEMGLPGPQAMHRRTVAPSLPELDAAMVWHRMLAPAILEGSAAFTSGSTATPHPIQFELGPVPVPVPEPIPDTDLDDAQPQRYRLPYQQGRFFMTGPNGKLAAPRILAGEWIDAIR